MKISGILIRASSAAAIFLMSTAARPLQRRAEQGAQLRAIARSCGIPASSLRLSGTDFVRVRALAHAHYRQLECVFTALREAGFRTPIAYVGAETSDPKAR